MESKIISVIVPVYNAAELISQTIESILNQTYEHIELILINDGSTDESEVIIQKWLGKDTRVVYLKQENKGPSAARNTGLEVSSGDYLLFVDADDTLNQNVIDKMVTEISKADLLLFGYDNYFGAESDKNYTVMPMIEGNYTIESFVPYFGELFKKNLIHYIWNKLYKREVIKEVRFDESVKVGEDLLFNLEVFKKIQQMAVTKKVLYTHNWFNKASITKKYHKELFNYRKKQYNAVRNFLNDYGCYNGENKRIVNNQYFRKYLTCMLSLEDEAAELTMNEKQQKLAEIAAHAEKDGLLTYTDKSLWEKMVVFMMKRHWRFPLFMLNKVMKIIQDGRRGK